MRRRLAGEEGIALPTALMVLTLCLVITAMVARGADQLSASSGSDQRAKRALSAADAGVSVAIRRLKSLPALAEAHCLTSAGVAPVGGECPSYTESLGHDARFTYTVTPVTTAAGGCYEVPGSVIPAGHRRRCITSVGTVGDEVRRVQAQVVAPPPGPGHWMGILGIDEVEIHNSARLSSCWSNEVPGPTIGSNVSVIIKNGAVLNDRCPTKAWGVSLPAGGTTDIHPGAEPAGQIRVTTAPGRFTIPAPPRDWESVENSNDNVRAVSNVTGSNFSYDPARRELDVGGSMRLGRGGDYSVCAIDLGNEASLDFPTNEKTRIFVDSPRRPGSSCSSTGFDLGTRARVNWPTSVGDTDQAALTARAKNLEIYLYDADLTLGNTVRFAALHQAERSTVTYDNGALTWGAVAAKKVLIRNSGDFQRPTGLSGADTDGPPYRTAGWAQCRNVAPVATDPESGC